MSEFPRSPSPGQAEDLQEAYWAWRAGSTFPAHPPRACPQCRASVVLNHINLRHEAILVCANKECAWPFEFLAASKYSGLSHSKLYWKWQTLREKYPRTQPTPPSPIRESTAATPQDPIPKPSYESSIRDPKQWNQAQRSPQPRGETPLHSDKNRAQEQVQGPVQPNCGELRDAEERLQELVQGPPQTTCEGPDQNARDGLQEQAQNPPQSSCEARHRNGKNRSQEQVQSPVQPSCQGPSRDVQDGSVEQVPSPPQSSSQGHSQNAEDRLQEQVQSPPRSSCGFSPQNANCDSQDKVQSPAESKLDLSRDSESSQEKPSIFDDLNMSDDEPDEKAPTAHRDSFKTAGTPVYAMPSPSPVRSVNSEDELFLSPFSSHAGLWSPRGSSGVSPSPRTETDTEFRPPIPKYLRSLAQPYHLPMLSPLPMTPRRRDEGASDSELSDALGLTPKADRMGDLSLGALSRAEDNESNMDDFASDSDSDATDGMTPNQLSPLKSPKTSASPKMVALTPPSPLKPALVTPPQKEPLAGAVARNVPTSTSQDASPSTSSQTSVRPTSQLERSNQQASPSPTETSVKQPSPLENANQHTSPSPTRASLSQFQSPLDKSPQYSSAKGGSVQKSPASELRGHAEYDGSTHIALQPSSPSPKIIREHSFAGPKLVTPSKATQVSESKKSPQMAKDSGPADLPQIVMPSSSREAPLIATPPRSMDLVVPAEQAPCTSSPLESDSGAKSPMKMTLKKQELSDSWQITSEDTDLVLPGNIQATPSIQASPKPPKSYTRSKAKNDQVLDSLSNRLSMNVGVPISICLPTLMPEDPVIDAVVKLSQKLRSMTTEEVHSDFQRLFKGLSSEGQPASLDFTQKIQKRLGIQDKSKLIFHVGEGKAAIDLPADTMDVSTDADKDQVSMFLCSNSDGVEGNALRGGSAKGSLVTPEQFRPKRGRPRKVPTQAGPTRFPNLDELEPDEPLFDYDLPLPDYGPEINQFLSDPAQVDHFKEHIQVLLRDFQIQDGWIQQGVDPVVAMLVYKACTHAGGPIDYLAILDWYGKMVNYEAAVERRAISSAELERALSPVVPISLPTPPQQRVEPVSNQIKTEVVDLPTLRSVQSAASVIPASVRPAPMSVTEVSKQAPATTSGQIGTGRLKVSCNFENSVIGPICVETEEEMKAVMAIIRENTAKAQHRGRALTQAPQYFSDAASARSLLSQEVLKYLDRAFTQKGLKENVVGKKKTNYPKRSQIIKIDPKTGEKIFPPGKNTPEILKIKVEHDKSLQKEKLNARQRLTQMAVANEAKASKSNTIREDIRQILAKTGTPLIVNGKKIPPKIDPPKATSSSLPIVQHVIHVKLPPPLVIPTPAKPVASEPTLHPPPSSTSGAKGARGPRRKYGGYKAKNPVAPPPPVSLEKVQSIAARILELPVMTSKSEPKAAPKPKEEKRKPIPPVKATYNRITRNMAKPSNPEAEAKPNAQPIEVKPPPKAIFVRKGQESKVQRLLKKRKMYTGFVANSKEQQPSASMSVPKLKFSQADNIGGVKRLIKSNGEVVQIPVVIPTPVNPPERPKVKKPAKTSQDEQDILSDLFKVAETLDLPPVSVPTRAHHDLNDPISAFNMAMTGNSSEDVLSFDDMF